MKKERFLGYLDALMDMAEAYQFNEDQIPELIGDIRKKAEELDEPIETLPTYPIYPWPTITYSTGTFEFESEDKEEYNITVEGNKNKIPNPNDWSIETNTPGPPDFKVVK